MAAVAASLNPLRFGAWILTAASLVGALAGLEVSIPFDSGHGS